jgi:hypothetical protein
VKIPIEMTGLCRLCGSKARTATLETPNADGSMDGRPISSLCIECTRSENAWHQAPPIPVSTPEEWARFHATYLRATWADVMPFPPKQ